MRRNLFALPLQAMLPLLVMLLLLAVGLPAHATSCTAGNPNTTSVIESTPTSDFTVNPDGTVTHAKTALTWKRCAEGQAWNGSTCTGTATTAIWANALKAANTANTAPAFAGYTDWRLPNMKELNSIVEFCGYEPSINQTAFPAAPAFHFWSGSSYVPLPTHAWLVNFGGGHTFTNFKFNSDNTFVRLVRGGQSVDSFDLLNAIYGVTYDGNTHTGGSVPADGNAYPAGATVNVLGNTGSLVKAGYTFIGWNTAPDGSGTSYAGGVTFTMGSGNVTLYAKWKLFDITPILMLLLFD